MILLNNIIILRPATADFVSDHMFRHGIKSGLNWRDHRSITEKQRIINLKHLPALGEQIGVDCNLEPMAIIINFNYNFKPEQMVAN